MKNTAQYKFMAKKIIAKLEARLEKESNPLYADWIISLMREGFKKQDAVAAFRKSKFILLADGSITTKALQKERKLRERLLAEEVRESFAVETPSGEVALYKSMIEAQQCMIDQTQWNLAYLRRRLRRRYHELEYQNKSLSEALQATADPKE